MRQIPNAPHSAAQARLQQAAVAMSPIRADLIGSDTCIALGITVHAEAHVLAMCRRLLDAGHDLATPLETYRGTTLCLIVRSIGEAAQLEIGKAGFKRRAAGAGAPPIPAG